MHFYKIFNELVFKAVLEIKQCDSKDLLNYFINKNTEYAVQLSTLLKEERARYAFVAIWDSMVIGCLKREKINFNLNEISLEVKLFRTATAGERIIQLINEMTSKEHMNEDDIKIAYIYQKTLLLTCPDQMYFFSELYDKMYKQSPPVDSQLFAVGQSEDLFVPIEGMSANYIFLFVSSCIALSIAIPTILYRELKPVQNIIDGA